MPAPTWNDLIIIIYFFYGLAFYSLGLALLVESGRASELGFARSMRLLAGFGLLHGVHEWLDMLDRGVVMYYDAHLPLLFEWLQLAVLIASFIALVAFGEHLLARENDNRAPSWRITLSITIFYVLSAIAVQVIYYLDDASWRVAADVLARYIMGIPGAVLATYALWQQRAIFRERGMASYAHNLTWGALALALYGIIGQFFPSPSVIFPSMVINSDLFIQITGFPVQLFRALMVTIVTFVMIRVLRALEVENEQRLNAVEQEKREAERRRREDLTRLNAELQEASEETARLLREVQQRDSLRGELLQRITSAQEAERRRIARELHDETGQTLTGLGMGLRGLSTVVRDNPDLAVQRINNLESMATTAIGELRRMINDLRPPQLDDMGLAAALRFMAQRFDSQDTLDVELDVKGRPFDLPSEVETILFRIAQEGITNVLKHAHASYVSVTLNYEDGPAITVQDDGQGFNPDAVMENGTMRTAWGLLGMKERASLINAELNIDSAPGEGTTLTVRLHETEPEDETEDKYHVDSGVNH